MRKRRRLADKLTIMVCAVLVAVSAFFYAPMYVEASETNVDLESLVGSSVSNSYSGSINIDASNGSKLLFGSTNKRLFDFVFNSSDYYRIDFSLEYSLTSSAPVAPHIASYAYLYGFSSIYYEGLNIPLADAVSSYSRTISSYFVMRGSDLNKIGVNAFSLFIKAPVGSYNYNVTYNLSVVDAVVLTGEESKSYQNGYNAGYSAGEQVGKINGYSNGYSDGFEAGEQSGYDSGFEAGKESVDTQSYYDMGYSAGYDAGYLSGYDDGYDDGYDAALSSLQGSSSSQSSLQHLGYVEGIEKSGAPFYVSSYGLIDMEEYQSGVNGYFYNTVPGTYSGLSYITYEVPFYTLNNNKYPQFNGDSVRFQFSLRSVIPSLSVDSGSASLYANLTNSRIREVYVTYKGQKYYGNIHSSASYAEFDFLVDDFATSGPHTLVSGDMTITFVVDNSVTIITDSDRTHFVSAVYTPKVSFSLGNSSSPFTIQSFVVNDRVSANIQSQTNSLTNGFNVSQGNSVNNDFSAGLNDFETAEDSLFATATTGLKDFTFFDIQSVPAMVTGMSFVGSIMSGWFTQAGGASGVGIVLSILFSIMLVAMVLGLYRWYQSKGGKD